MSTKKRDYYDGYDGLAEEMKKSKVKLSQCVNCENNLSTNTCNIFGEKPYRYASALANVKCPSRKEK